MSSFAVADFQNPSISQVNNSELESIDVYVPDDSEIILASLMNEQDKKLELESYILYKEIDLEDELRKIPEDDSESVFKALSINFYDKGLSSRSDIRTPVCASSLRLDESPRTPLGQYRADLSSKLKAKIKQQPELSYFKHKTFQASKKTIEVQRSVLSKSNSKQGGDLLLPAEKLKQRQKQEIVSPIDLSKLDSGINITKGPKLQKSSTAREPSSNYYIPKEFTCHSPQKLSSPKRRASLMKSINTPAKKNNSILLKSNSSHKNINDLSLKDSVYKNMNKPKRIFNKG